MSVRLRLMERDAPPRRGRRAAVITQRRAREGWLNAAPPFGDLGFATTVLREDGLRGRLWTYSKSTTGAFAGRASPWLGGYVASELAVHGPCRGAG